MLQFLTQTPLSRTSHLKKNKLRSPKHHLMNFTKEQHPLPNFTADPQTSMQPEITFQEHLHLSCMSPENLH